MKKVLILACVAIAATFALSSCKKCVTCKVSYGGAVVYTGAETCGNSKDIDAYTATVKAAYSGSGYSIDCPTK